MANVYIEIEVDEKNKDKEVEKLKGLGYNVKEVESAADEMAEHESGEVISDKETPADEGIDGEDMARQFKGMKGLK